MFKKWILLYNCSSIDNKMAIIVIPQKLMIIVINIITLNYLSNRFELLIK